MSHFYLARSSIRKIKEKKKKRNINNDLVDLPSHDNLCCLSKLHFFELFEYPINQSQISKWPFVIHQR